MTDEQFNTLALYEKNLETALRGRWAMNPGTPGLKRIHAVLDEINGKKTHMQYFCGTCVLRMLRDAAKVYFPEKERRSAPVPEPEFDPAPPTHSATEKPETASPTPKKAAKTPAKAEAKKTPKKSTKAAKIVS